MCRGNLRRVQSLIRSGGDVNEQNPGGNSVLSVAIETGNQDIALALLAAGADVQAKGEKFFFLLAAMSTVLVPMDAPPSLLQCVKATRK